jgi:hypothetical protein
MTPFCQPQFACSPSDAAQERYALYQVDLMTFGPAFNPRRIDRGTRAASGGMLSLLDRSPYRVANGLTIER